MNWTVVEPTVLSIEGVPNNEILMTMPDGASRLLKLTAGKSFVWPEEATLVMGEGRVEARWPDGATTAFHSYTAVTLSGQAKGRGKDWVSVLGKIWHLCTDKIIEHRNGKPTEYYGPTPITGVRG